MSRLVRKRGLVTFAILVLIAEVAGRSLTAHIDRVFHVDPIARPDASYYPLLLVGVKIVGALALAGLLARGTRARAAAAAGDRLLTALGRGHARRSPRLSPNLPGRDRRPGAPAPLRAVLRVQASSASRLTRGHAEEAAGDPSSVVCNLKEQHGNTTRSRTPGGSRRAETACARSFADRAHDGRLRPDMGAH